MVGKFYKQQSSLEKWTMPLLSSALRANMPILDHIEFFVPKHMHGSQCYTYRSLSEILPPEKQHKQGDHFMVVCCLTNCTQNAE